MLLPIESGVGPLSAASIRNALFPKSVIQPQGRLTLQSGAPVQTSDQTAKTTVYYDSFIGTLVPLWNSSSWDYLGIASDEISMGLDAGVPRVTSGSLYDIFAINNSGSLVIAIGPAWSTATSRGTGAGTTELQRKDGIWTNKVSLTHAYGGASGTTDYGAVSANQATYLGTFYATANGQTAVQIRPSAGAGGSNTQVALFNAYNRVRASTRTIDSTASWSYNSSTWRAADNSNSNRATFVDGLQVIPLSATAASVTTGATTSNWLEIGIDLDSSSATPSVIAFSGAGSSVCVSDEWAPQLGQHFLQQMEHTAAAGALTISGNSIYTYMTVQLEI